MLGPLLFLIYINGIASITLCDGTLVLFADDIVIYRPIHFAADLSISWNETWLLLTPGLPVII